MLSRTWPRAMRAFAPTPILNKAKKSPRSKRIDAQSYTRYRAIIMLCGTKLGRCNETIVKIRGRLLRKAMRDHIPTVKWSETQIARIEGDQRHIQDIQISVRETHARKLLYESTQYLAPYLAAKQQPAAKAISAAVVNRPMESRDQMENLVQLVRKIEEARKINPKRRPTWFNLDEPEEVRTAKTLRSIETMEARLERAATLALEAATNAADRALGNITRFIENRSPHAYRKTKGYENLLRVEHKRGKGGQNEEPEPEEAKEEEMSEEQRKEMEAAKRSKRQERKARKKSKKEAKKKTKLLHDEAKRVLQSIGWDKPIETLPRIVKFIT